MLRYAFVYQSPTRTGKRVFSTLTSAEEEKDYVYNQVDYIDRRGVLTFCNFAFNDI